MMTKKNLILIYFTCFNIGAFAQDFDNNGWIFLTHKQKVSKQWDVLADFQLRSSNDWKNLQTILVRTAASYNIIKHHSVALGYAYKGDWSDEQSKPFYMLEHRVYEQYIYDGKIKRTEMMARFRLEQRFVEDDAHFDFSQRVRGFLSFQIPLIADKDFTKGVYTALQNEVFVNISNKENVNNSFFDQNRLMGSLGYRWSEHIDTELGYIYWRKKQTDGSTNSNVIQLMITTKL